MVNVAVRSMSRPNSPRGLCSRADERPLTGWKRGDASGKIVVVVVFVVVVVVVFCRC